MPDLRAAILARCDELEKLANAAATREGGAVWHACYRPNEAAWAWDVATSLDGSGGGIVDGRTEETAAHVAAWDPAAALILVAGVREIVTIHAPWDADAAEHADAAEVLARPGERVPPRPWCRSCGGLTPWPCETLTALAGMLGVDDA